MQYDTRSSTLIARMLMSEAVAEAWLADQLAKLSHDDATALANKISASFRNMIDQAIGALAKAPGPQTSMIIGELPGKRDAIITQLLGPILDKKD